MDGMASSDDEVRSMDGLIWHYTNGQVLGNVLGKHELWASSTEFMNDREERRLADRYLVQARDAAHLRMPLDLDEGEAWASDIVLGAENPRFLLSASLHGDSLTMWRGYAGTNSISFAIGLDPEAPLHVLDPEPHSSLDEYPSSPWDPEFKAAHVSAWFKVTYSVADAEELARQAVEEIARVFSDHLKPDAIYDAGDVAAVAWESTENLRNRIKHRGFEDERETRIMASVDKSLMRFRAGKWGMVPYIVMTGAPTGSPNVQIAPKPAHLPIKAVRISPTPADDRAAAVKSLKALLDSCGYSDVQVEASDIPYRE